MSGPAARDLSRRSGEAEWLDGADLPPEELERVLRDLARFNGVMLGHRPVLAWLRSAVKAASKSAIKSGTKSETLTLIDVGCGYGDLLRAIRRWADRRKLAMRLIGVDLSAETIRIAQRATGAHEGIEYHAADIFAFDAGVRPDFIVSSLLTHHMSDAQIVQFLRWMERTAQSGWFIYDLQRHAVPFYFIGLMGRLTRLHRMVIHDGRISVARSLTKREWLARLAEAGIERDSVRLRWFLFRFAIGRLR
jgi:2-polyprenyl-3-methyl-5-hydroxy-6-metoxy-1,4-benzoquinol methylase